MTTGRTQRIAIQLLKFMPSGFQDTRSHKYLDFYSEMLFFNLIIIQYHQSPVFAERRYHYISIQNP